MTQRPLHLVNAGLVLSDEPLPATATVDLTLSATRIDDRHGAAAGKRYRHFLGRAVAAAPTADRDELLTYAGLAAWRSGALGFRTDALRRLDLALTADTPALAALAAALGLGEGGVVPFVELQRASRFGWPGRHTPGELLAVIGGFRGLFGPWLAPPVAVLPGERPGTFLIRTHAGGASAAEEWLLTVDVFGHTLVRLAADDAGDPGATTATSADTAASAAAAASAARWADAGDTIAGPAEAGADGASLRIHGYTAQLRLPGTAE